MCKTNAGHSRCRNRAPRHLPVQRPAAAASGAAANEPGETRLGEVGEALAVPVNVIHGRQAIIDNNTYSRVMMITISAVALSAVGSLRPWQSRIFGTSLPGLKLTNSEQLVHSETCRMWQYSLTTSASHPLALLDQNLRRLLRLQPSSTATSPSTALPGLGLWGLWDMRGRQTGRSWRLPCRAERGRRA